MSLTEVKCRNLHKNCFLIDCGLGTILPFQIWTFLTISTLVKCQCKTDSRGFVSEEQVLFSALRKVCNLLLWLHTASTVLKYKFKILILYLSILFRLHFISEEYISTFYSSVFILQCFMLFAVKPKSDFTSKLLT